MFYGGKPKLLATLVAALGVTLGSTGCMSDRASSASNSFGPGGKAAMPNVGADGPMLGNKQTAINGSAPGNVQQVAYLGDDGHGKPIVGQPPASSPQAMVGPGCGGRGCGGPGPIPTEINPVSHPPYTVAPPDILFIDAARLVPKPPYRVEPLEVLFIQVTDTLPNQPINGTFVIAPEGTISLGYGYGSVVVRGLTVDQIQGAIRQHLSNVLRNPQVSVSLAQFRGQQQVRGEHLVRPDGTISLGIYGSVYVAGMTLGQVKTAVEAHLREYVINPQVAVDVFAYNSKRYYVIFDGGGYGEQIYPMPITGNETVLDAISNLTGLPAVSSLRRIWIARPAPCGHPCDQILPVDWRAIVMGGSTCTNYQIFPGDRIYVDADCLVKTDLWLAKILAPVERILGITLLGSSTVNTIRNSGNGTTGVIIP